MGNKVVCCISIFTARSPGIGGFHEHIKEGMDYIDTPQYSTWRYGYVWRGSMLWHHVLHKSSYMEILWIFRGEELRDGKSGQ